MMMHVAKIVKSKSSGGPRTAVRLPAIPPAWAVLVDVLARVTGERYHWPVTWASLSTNGLLCHNVRSSHGTAIHAVQVRPPGREIGCGLRQAGGKARYGAVWISE